MLHIKGTPFQSTAAFLSNAVRVAEFYGFESMDNLPRTRSTNRPLAPGARPDTDIIFARKDEKSLPAVARKLTSINRPYPLLVWRSIALGASQGGGFSFELHAIGISNAIAEALLIVVANAILEESGMKQRSLMLSNMGGPESSSRYNRDVATYLRKHIDSIALPLRPRATTDPIGTLVQLIERGHPAISRAPQPMDYLSEEERRRFWDVLEYIEIIGIPYELSGTIVGSRDCWAQTLFEIMGEDSVSGDRVPLAFGGRYDPLLSRFARKPVSGAIVSIAVEERGASNLKPLHTGVRSMYFAHLGSEARRKSLPLLESLRQNGIPVYHSLWNERIGEQMAAASNLATPFVLIMGHKEAMEGTVLVREVATNSQESIALPELPAYLKRKRVPMLAAQ